MIQQLGADKYGSALFWVCIVGLAVIALIAFWLIDAVATVKEAKYNSFNTVAPQPEQLSDSGYYDLYEFMSWLDQKGIKREGFRTNEGLVDEYISWQDDNNG